MAQICMFRCAPDLGTKGYDRCLAECFGPESSASDEEAGPDQSADSGDDISPLFGFWQAVHTSCGTISDGSWHVDASGASPYEASCELRSARRNGDTFTLEQKCTYFEDEVEQTVVRVRLLAKDAIDIEGKRYARCEQP